MTIHDLQSSKRKKIKKIIGCILMLISIPVFFRGAWTSLFRGNNDALFSFWPRPFFA